MSILIKGMEMPQGNSAINVLIYADGTVYTGHVNDSRYSAVSAPAPYGRLIDADALANTLRDVSKRQKYDKLFSDNVLSVGDVFDAIIADLEGTGTNGYKLIPTVIEAEGSEE